MSQGQERQKPDLERIVRRCVERIEALERKGTPTLAAAGGGIAYGSDAMFANIPPASSATFLFNFDVPARSSVVAMFYGVALPQPGGGDVTDFHAGCVVHLAGASGLGGVVALPGAVSEGHAFQIIDWTLAICDPGLNQASVDFNCGSSDGNIEFEGRIIVMSFQPSGTLRGAED